MTTHEESWAETLGLKHTNVSCEVACVCLIGDIEEIISAVEARARAEGRREARQVLLNTIGLDMNDEMEDFFDRFDMKLAALDIREQGGVPQALNSNPKIMSDLLNDDYKPPFKPKKSTQKELVDRLYNDIIQNQELQNFGRPIVTEDYSDSPFADRKEGNKENV